jgi:hypothetical protein
VTAVLSGDLTHSWLFRLGAAEGAAPSLRPGASAPRSDLKIVEYRPMACRFDASAKVPEAVWSAPGTSRIER